MAKSQKRHRKKSQRRQRMEAEARQARARRRRRALIQLGAILGLAALVAALTFRAQRSKGTSATPTPSPTAPSPSPSPSPSPTAETIACGGTKPPRGNTDPRPAPALSLNRSKTYTATVETSCGAITVELADDERPQTVNSFVSLARSGFYDGLTFHRVKGDFVVQGGDPAGNGTGGPGYNVTEAPAAGTKYPRGTVAMAKGGVEPAGTFGSQFFFVSGAEGEALPPLYAMLGRVRDGIEVLDRVEAVPVEGERPLQTIYIVKISITES